MKIKPVTILLVAAFVIFILLLSRSSREHLTGATIPTVDDALAYPNTPGSQTFDEWFVPNFPQGGFDSTTYIQIAKATLWFVVGYSANYAKASAPLSKNDFYNDFLPVYNAEWSGMAQNGVVAPGTTGPLGDTSTFVNNVYANLVYIYYYGPKSATPYVAPPPPPPAPAPAPTPAPAPAPAPSTTTPTAAPPAASSSPNQPLTFYVPQPCKTEYKSVPGGSVELRCFD